MRSPGGGPPPVVGLSAHRERARWKQWEADADLLSARYAAAVEAAGGVPVLLPVGCGTREQLAPAAAAVAERLDALVVTGGPDVTPGQYGEAPGPHTGGTRED